MNIKGPAGWTQMYSNSFFFCSKCVEMVPPPRAIQSFFCCQNVIDIIWIINYLILALRPPQKDFPATTVFWIIFILGVIHVVCFIGGLIVSILARSELRVLNQNGRGSSPVGKTKIALLLYTIGLSIAVLFFCLFWGFAIYFIITYGTSGDVVSGFIAIVMIIFLIILLPYALIYISQLVQVLKMRNALRDCETGAGVHQ